MEIGIISDTHGLVRPRVFETFEGVDLILHAGDIGGFDVIAELEAIAPVKAVAGNNDIDLAGRFQEKIRLRLNNRLFLLQHIFREIPDKTTEPKSPISKIVVFGHSHKPCNEHIGETLYFNPGSAGPRRFNLPCTAGRLTLEEGKATGRIIHLE